MSERKCWLEQPVWWTYWEVVWANNGETDFLTKILILHLSQISSTNFQVKKELDFCMDQTVA